MDLSFSPEQRQLQASLRSYLKAGRDSAEPGSRWRDFADKLGILGVSIGDSGDGAVETMLIMEELGAALAPEPFVDAIVIAGFVLSHAGGREVELGRIAGGTSRHAFAWMEPQTRYGLRPAGTRLIRHEDGLRLHGKKLVVEGVPSATRLIVTAASIDEGDGQGVSLLLVDPMAAGVRITNYQTIDGRHAADIVFEDVVVAPDTILGAMHRALPLIEHAADWASAALGAEALGLMRTMIDETIAYVSQRHQFGRALGEFQALQHRIVDMFLALERARSAVYLAVLSLNEPPPARARAASTAGVLVAEACRFVGENAIQLHGGMGMPQDAPISRYFRRAMVIEGAFGTRDHHLARYAALVRGA